MSNSEIVPGKAYAYPLSGDGGEMKTFSFVERIRPIPAIIEFSGP